MPSCNDTISTHWVFHSWDHLHSIYYFGSKRKKKNYPLSTPGLPQYPNTDSFNIILLYFLKCGKTISLSLSSAAIHLLLCSDLKIKKKRKQKNHADQTFIMGALAREMTAMEHGRAGEPGLPILRFVFFVSSFSLPLREGRTEHLQTQAPQVDILDLSKRKDDSLVTRLLGKNIKPDSKSEKIKCYLD